jgi:hypothetical protein
MTMDAEIWRVQLPTGELRAFSLDALDDAFQAGIVHGGTLVLAPGAATWAPLAEIAGLDAPESVMTPSLSPVAISTDAYQLASLPPPAPVPMDLGDLSDDALKPKRGRFAFAGVAFVAAVAACGVLLAPKLGKVLAAVHPDRGNAVNAVQAPPAAVDVTGDGYKPANQLTEEQKRLLLEADKRKEEERKKREEAASKVRGTKRSTRGKSTSPFVSGGDKYDPLNGSL